MSEAAEKKQDDLECQDKDLTDENPNTDKNSGGESKSEESKKPSVQTGASGINEAVKQMKAHPKLSESRFELAEQMRAIFFATVPPGTTREQILQEDFWTHVGHRMLPGSRIEVVCDDGSFFAELYVRDCGRLFATVAEMRFLAFDSALVRQSSPSIYAVVWGGNHHKWRVMRNGEDEPIKSGFETKGAAMAWVSSQEQALRR